MSITTDYTAEANKDTLHGGALQSYRLMHWMCDILKNFFADPTNIKDERISHVFKMQDGATPEQLNALFRVDAPYSPNGNKSGLTPGVVVSLGATQYPVQHVHEGSFGINGLCSSRP